MFLNEEFIRVYEELNKLNEAKYKNGHLELAKPINLSNCRMITSDVTDIRGELEQSACLEYNGVLTRVGAQALIFRDGIDGKEVLMRLWRSAVYLPGGGVDIQKDGTDAKNTVQRETLEELNMTITNVKLTNSSYWEYSEKQWVKKHVANHADRWNGYYTFIFTADYLGEGDNDLPEEAGRYRWHKVKDILARPDTRKLKYLKDAIIASGYTESKLNTDLEEDTQLTEAKQLGYVSYAFRKSPQSRQHPLKSLESVLYSGVIKASKEEDSSNYVSTSRNIMGHLRDGEWKCAIVLDGDKLTNRYKVKPVDYNSTVYFKAAASNKQLTLQDIRKYQAVDEDGNFLDKYMYMVNMGGSSFNVDISESTYNILKTIMKAYNAQLAVSTTGRAADKYKNRTVKDVKRFYNLRGQEKIKTSDDLKTQLYKYTAEGDDLFPWQLDAIDKLDKSGQLGAKLSAIGSRLSKEKTPTGYLRNNWVCIETCGYDTPQSGLVLRQDKLASYRDIVISQHGVDITAPTFFRRLGGNSYSDESEERVVAKLAKFVNVYGVEEEGQNYGVDISGCIKAILVDEKHTMAFTEPEESLLDKKTLYLHQDGQKTNRTDNTPEIAQLALSIRKFANNNNIPIILFNRRTTNQEILSKIS